MKRLMFAVVAALALFATVQQASAKTVTINDPLTSADDEILGHKFNTHVNNFFDVYEFTVGQASTLILDFTLTGNISLGVTLVGNGLPHGQVQLGTLMSPGAPTGTFTVAGLVAGTQYSLDIIGSACSCSKYVFDMGVQAAAVTPIPPTLLMFLTGLGGLGGLAWRRGKLFAATTGSRSMKVA